MFIRLTLRKKGTEDKPIYLNPSLFTAIRNEAEYTRIDTVDSIWNVLETPQEIMKGIEEEATIRTKEIECKGGNALNNILIFFLGSIFGTLVALMVFAMFHLNDND